MSDMMWLFASIWLVTLSTIIIGGVYLLYKTEASYMKLTFSHIGDRFGGVLRNSQKLEHETNTHECNKCGGECVVPADPVSNNDNGED